MLRAEPEAGMKFHYRLCLLVNFDEGSIVMRGIFINVEEYPEGGFIHQAKD